MVIDVPSRGVQSDWMSVKIETELEWFRFSSSQPINICMALHFSSKEHLGAAPHAFSVVMIVVNAGSPLVTTTPASPLSVPPLAEPSE